MANLETECLRLERDLRTRNYRPGGYVTIKVRDPKPRMVSAAPFRDRVVHHALCAQIAPLFERGFIFDTYANRKGKGTHRCIDRYERFRDRFRYVLRCDIYRYFPAIDHAILKQDIRRRIECENTLWLIDRIIDGSNPQEPVELYFPGDGLFAPFDRRRGLPIGNLTSQLFANLYLNPLDHFIKEKLRARGYVRYVDDFALFSDDVDRLLTWRTAIESFLEGRRLRLHQAKTYVQSTSRPSRFLGFELHPGYRRLPHENVARFRNRLRGLRDRWRAETVSMNEVDQRVQAWIAHAELANTWRLRHAIFRGGRFDPARGPDRSQAVPGPARRFLEQQSREPSIGKPQQEQPRQPEQQQRLPCGPYARQPEHGRSRTAVVRK